MTGMGSDGALGAKAPRQAGGEILIQDQATSVVWGMPGAVAAAGLADQIYRLGNIALEIIRRVASRRTLALRASAAVNPEDRRLTPSNRRIATDYLALSS